VKAAMNTGTALHRGGCRGETTMKKQSASRHSTAKVPRGRRAANADADEMNQATGDQFEREGMGIAPKE